MSDEPNDELIARVADALRDRGSARPGFDARVMNAVRADHPSLLRELAAWFTEPQRVAVSPLGVLAGAAAIALIIAGTAAVAPQLWTPAPLVPGTARPAAGAAVETVRFVLAAPAARSVALVGSFNNWNPDATPLQPAGDATGVWVVDVPLAPGRHEYGFIIDGREWRPDPAAPQGGASDYGPPNSVIMVSQRQS